METATDSVQISIGTPAATRRMSRLTRILHRQKKAQRPERFATELTPRVLWIRIGAVFLTGSVVYFSVWTAYQIFAVVFGFLLSMIERAA